MGKHSYRRGGSAKSRLGNDHIWTLYCKEIQLDRTDSNRRVFAARFKGKIKGLKGIRKKKNAVN